MGRVQDLRSLRHEDPNFVATKEGDVIRGFFGPYRFLSTFYPCSVRMGGEHYRTVEHAYQAAKTYDVVDRRNIRLAQTPGEARRLGETLDIRSDWGSMRMRVMADLIRQKFAHDPLRLKLLDTGDSDLINDNTWGDNFWGIFRGKGANLLGEITMAIREELRLAKGVAA